MTGVNSEEKKSRDVTYGTYLLVWVGLVLLTGMTVSVAGMGLGTWPIFIALGIAGTKSGLILNYFMHLRSERLLIFKIIIPLVIAVFLVFILLTFADLVFRGGMK
jgi:cytochrome c oxidase subunit 4